MRDRIFTALTLVVFIVAVILSVSCAGPAVYGECSPDGLDEALDDACTRWPSTCEVGQRMDFFCVDAEAIASVSRCGDWYDDVEACTMWIGTSQAHRGRVYVREGTPVSAAAIHEAQHWHLWDDDETNDCQTHTASCGWKD